MKIREAERLLHEMGFTCKAGKKHDKWSHPDGRMVTLSRSAKHPDLYGALKRKIELWYSGKTFNRANQVQ